MMGVVTVKTIILLFLAISAILAATSDPAQRSRFVTLSAMQEKQTFEETPKIISHEKKFEEAREVVHERMLRMNTHDYGRYNPSPTLSKPRFKRIPN